jgi:hypothetical protein
MLSLSLIAIPRRLTSAASDFAAVFHGRRGLDVRELPGPAAILRADMYVASPVRLEKVVSE